VPPTAGPVGVMITDNVKSTAYDAAVIRAMRIGSALLILVWVLRVGAMGLGRCAEDVNRAGRWGVLLLSAGLCVVAATAMARRLAVKEEVMTPAVWVRWLAVGLAGLCAMMRAPGWWPRARRRPRGGVVPHRRGWRVGHGRRAG